MKKYWKIGVATEDGNDDARHDAIRRAAIQMQDELSILDTRTWFFLPDGDPRIDVLRAMAASDLNLNVCYFPITRYDRNDIEAAPYALLGGVAWATQKCIDAGADYGTEYDMSRACRSCGAGAMQIGGLKVKPSDLPKRQPWIRTLQAMLFHESVIAPLRGIKGFEQCLLAAQSKRTKEVLPWFELVSDYTLPALSGRGIERRGNPTPCQVCDRGDWWFASVFRDLWYENVDSDPEQLPPVCMTWECWTASYIFAEDHKRYAPQAPVVCREIALHMFDNVGEQAEVTPLKFK